MHHTVLAKSYIACYLRHVSSAAQWLIDHVIHYLVQSQTALSDARSLPQGTYGVARKVWNLFGPWTKWLKTFRQHFEICIHCLMKFHWDVLLLVQVTAWVQTGDRLISGSMMTHFADVYIRPEGQVASQNQQLDHSSASKLTVPHMLIWPT